MVYLNYYNLKKKKQIEIIYKSPSIFLEGVFLKTPEMLLGDFVIYKHDKQNKYNQYETYNLYSNAVHNTANSTNASNVKSKVNNYTTAKLETVDIKFYLTDSNPQHAFFINLLQTLDTYIIQYLDKYKTEIENELVLNYRDNRQLSEYKYIKIIKTGRPYANNNTTDGNISQGNKFEITMKSYLDKKLINDLIKKKQRIKTLKIDTTVSSNATIIQDSSISTQQEQKYIFTFNISNIYFGNTNLIPLIKTNNVEIV
jgi:hypothetical protein